MSFDCSGVLCFAPVFTEETSRFFKRKSQKISSPEGRLITKKEYLSTLIECIKGINDEYSTAQNLDTAIDKLERIRNYIQTFEDKTSKHNNLQNKVRRVHSETISKMYRKKSASTTQPPNVLLDMQICSKSSSPLEMMQADLRKFSQNEKFVDIWSIPFSKKDILHSWTCNDKGHFSLQLKDSLSLYMEDYPSKGGDPGLYQLCFCLGNIKKGSLSVTGKFDFKEKALTFTKGAEVLVSQGRFPLSTVKFGDPNDLTLVGKVTIGWISFSKSLSFSYAGLKEAWEKGELVEKDDKKFLKDKMELYASMVNDHLNDDKPFFLRDHIA